jgi:hypothetical protein
MDTYTLREDYMCIQKLLRVTQQWRSEPPDLLKPRQIDSTGGRTARKLTCFDDVIVFLQLSNTYDM